jgi:hypothetical protein
MTSVFTLSRVAGLCLLAGAAHASPVHVSTAADAGVPVPPTVYAPAARYQPAAPDAASPDRAWREQNRIVAAQNSMMLTMGGQAPGADPHAGHAGHAPAAAADPHAGHQMAGAGNMSGAAKPCCAGEGCCCKDSGARGACCGKDLADAPQSCAPARPAPASDGAPSGGHQHGAHR